MMSLGRRWCPSEQVHVNYDFSIYRQMKLHLRPVLTSIRQYLNTGETTHELAGLGIKLFFQITEI